MTNQEILDRNYQVFLVEGKPRSILKFSSESSAEGAVYRYPPDPTHGCALGCCLPQELRDLNPPNSFAFLEKGHPYREFFAGNDEDFLTAMQAWHDFNRCSPSILKRTARQYGLEWPGDKGTLGRLVFRVRQWRLSRKLS